MGVIYHLICSKFHILITFIKLSPKFEYVFCPMNVNQDGPKMAGACWFALLLSHLSLHFFQIS